MSCREPTKNESRGRDDDSLVRFVGTRTSLLYALKLYGSHKSLPYHFSSSPALCAKQVFRYDAGCR
eukprot:6049096-Pyramimonas_sp.AAC.1